VFGCQGDQNCEDTCLADTSPEAKQQWVTIFSCVVAECGQPPQDGCAGQAILNGACSEEFESCLACTPTCTGKQCGAAGCGDVCGECPQGFACGSFGLCECQPQCITPSGQQKQCGADGCGGVCGFCPVGSVCAPDGQCLGDVDPPCEPSCTNKECGGDGCGGSCGACPADEECDSGQCVEVELTCAEIVTCTFGCGGFDLSCMAECSQQGSPEAQGKFNLILPCIINTCGFNLGPECIFEALANECSDQWENCQEP